MPGHAVLLVAAGASGGGGDATGGGPGGGSAGGEGGGDAESTGIIAGGGDAAEKHPSDPFTTREDHGCGMRLSKPAKIVRVITPQECVLYNRSVA